jgi:transposase
LAGSSGVALGGDALLRLLRRDRDASRIPRVLGVDERAWRRARNHGSVRVDLEAGRPIDWREDRSAGTRAGWLQEHPGVEIVVRDRSPE